MNMLQRAQFYPNNATTYLMSLVFTTREQCICQCYENRLCLTGSYTQNDQICSMYSAQLGHGEIRIISNAVVSVFNFPEKIIIPGKNDILLHIALLSFNLDPIIPPEMMEWSFDRTFNDAYNTWNGTFVSSIVGMDQTSDDLWVSPGYAGYGSAVRFPSNSYYIINQKFNLATTDFTVSVWFAVTFNFTAHMHDYFSFFSHCQATNTDLCLHLVAGKDQFRLGFYDDDLIIVFQMNLYQWYHVAYVYDRSLSLQKIFVNGNLIGVRSNSGSYLGNDSTIALGGIPLLSGSNMNSGYIDKITYISRIKSDKEMLNDATLVASYTFDNSYLDAGPNKIMNTTQMETKFDVAGQSNEALVFDLNNPSYFQTNGFYFLGRTNYSYSFTLWICPLENLGTILQVG